jgi:hypothetical protein
MTQPIFVRTYNDEGKIRDSYQDYWLLVKLSGFAECELDAVKRGSNNTYIFSPDDGNVKAFCEVPHQAKYVLWQLERPGHVKSEVPVYFDEMWVSDCYFNTLVTGNCRYVTLGGDPGFGEFSFNEPKEYNFAHMSYEFGRRHDIYQDLRNLGYKLAPNAWPPARAEILKKSGAMLCIHQDKLPIIEPLRYTIAACYGLPIVAEYSKDVYPYMVEFLDEPDLMDKHAQAVWNYRKLTKELTFKKCVEEALK